MLFQKSATMTDGDVQYLFPAKQCLWPVLNPMTVRELAKKQNLSDQHLGAEIRKMLVPVHFTCVPDKDLHCNLPKYTDFDPLGRQSCHPDKIIKAKDLSKHDLMEMPESEEEYKLHIGQKKRCLPFGLWNLREYTYKY